MNGPEYEGTLRRISCQVLDCGCELNPVDEVDSDTGTVLNSYIEIRHCSTHRGVPKEKEL